MNAAHQRRRRDANSSVDTTHRDRGGLERISRRWRRFGSQLSAKGLPPSSRSPKLIDSNMQLIRPHLPDSKIVRSPTLFTYSQPADPSMTDSPRGIRA